MKYKIFQIFFEKNQINDIDPLFTPFDNTENKHPELREYHNFNRIIDEGFTDNLDAWGVFGPRWQEKLLYSSSEIIEAINFNPGNDVYIFNHGRAINALTRNLWEQGEFCIKGITKVICSAFNSGGYDLSALDCLTTNYTCCCSYFVATKKFWGDYLTFLKDIIGKLESLTGEEADIYNRHGHYLRDKNLTLFPFIIERLFPTFLCLNKYKVYSKPYDYTLYSNQTTKENTDVLTSLYWLKNLAIQKNSPSIRNHWEALRLFTLLEIPDLLYIDEPLPARLAHPEKYSSFIEKKHPN